MQQSYEVCCTGVLGSIIYRPGFFLSEATFMYCLEDITVLEQNTDPISQHDFAYTFL